MALTIKGTTKLLGVVGWPVAHTFSPAMHNAALADLDLNYVYLPLPVSPEDLTTAIAGLVSLGFRGFNITVPHKQTILPLLDEIDDGARAIGAVNTVVIERSATGAHLTGYNTDWSGFQADLAGHDISVHGRDCLVLGAGGSARAVVYALASNGGRVQLLARRPEQAEALIADLAPFLSGQRVAAGQLSTLPALLPTLSAPLLVNTTPVGMTPNVAASVLPQNCPIPAGSFVYDLVYNPMQTRLLQQAAAAGARSANGLGMLLHQGAQAFALWTGQKANLQRMRAAITPKD